MAYLQLQGIEKEFGNVRVIRGIDLEIKQGEFIVFVGPSGCGKSTLLRLIAGLEETSAGTLMLDGRDITEQPSSKRDLAMVFQSYALYPHLSVFENMSFALKLAKVDAAVIQEKVGRAAKILNLTDYLQRTPKELSGGQRQRVAIGRAIVRAPKVFLFDEPLSNLDAALRGQTRIEIAKLHRDLGATTIYVTHDQVEAMTLADRVVVLRDGRIEQVGTPLELYDRPANQFVAQFIGTPQMNMVAAKDLQPLVNRTGLPVEPDGHIGLRPENISLCAAGQGQLDAKVELIEALGAETLVYVSTASGVPLVVRQNERTELLVGSAVGLHVDVDAAHLFDAAGKITRTGVPCKQPIHVSFHFKKEPTMSHTTSTHTTSLQRLAGRHAVLTGAAGGIGIAVLAAYLREGACCTAVDLPQAPSQDLVQLMQQYPASLHYVAADVAQQASIDAMLACAIARFGPIHALFNNAATFTMGPLLEQGPADYDFVFNVNVKGMFFVMQAVLKHMLAQGVQGSVINLASQAGRRGEALVAHYCASKAAVISYTQSAALAMAPHGIRVNGIAPGVIDTPMWGKVDALFAKYEGLAIGEKKRQVGLAVPLGRMGNPSDLEGAALFLASSESAYITAQTLNVDGGNWMS